MRNTVKIAAVIFGFLLAGCGQKGPLYFPEQTGNEEIQTTDDGVVIGAESQTEANEASTPAVNSNESP